MNKVLKRVFWRWFLFGQSGWNYEKMQGLGYLYSIYPFLEKKYAKPEEQKDAAKVHSQFFNTNNTMAPGILGVNIALEEQTGLAGKDAVAGIKTGLMGPLAGIGDTLFFCYSDHHYRFCRFVPRAAGQPGGACSLATVRPWFACCLCALASAKGIRKGSTCWGL
ncbi:PTS system protein [Klebsiella michiganensis]|uniref:PTS system protein n=1 Tax=Klebsiella michiganensis TaxID=1134687 RepID=A0A7H4N2A2_9ENTR|nr:PTS system protein [Klebsiella michiganensis]